jgi:hypothetical protein
VCPQLVDNVEPVYTFGSSAEDAPVPSEAEAKLSASAGTTATTTATTCRIYTGWVNANRGSWLVAYDSQV